MKRKIQENLAYEIPVDLSQCSEEEKENWLVRRANIRNGGRLRNNPLVDDSRVNPEDCKSADGEWKKFVKEQCSDAELEAFEELNRMCDSHVILDYLPQNHRLRFLHGNHFNVQKAFDNLLESERIRYRLGCDRVTGKEVYDFGHRAGAIIGRDVEGRPVIYTRCADWQLGVITVEQQQQNILLIKDYVFATMPPTVDQYIWIFNLEGFGYNHFYMEDIKMIITTLLKVFVNTNHKIVCCYPNFVTRMAHKAVLPFLNERIRRKIVFLDEVSLENFASVGLHMTSLPQEWGGGPEAFNIEQG